MCVCLCARDLVDTCHISQGRHILFMAPKKKETRIRRFAGRSFHFISLPNGERNEMEQLPFDHLQSQKKEHESAYVIHRILRRFFI